MSATAADTMQGFVHPALFYRGQEEYLAGTVPFIQDGLAAGEPVAVSVPTWNLRLLSAALGADASRVRLMDMTQEGRNPGRIIPGVLRAFADAHPAGRVRIIGEPIWAGRSATEYPACAQHEALINAAFAGRDVTILCPYDVAALDATVVADALVTHPLVIDEAGERPSEVYAPEAVVAGYNEPLPVPADADVVQFDAANLSAVRASAAVLAKAYGLAADRIPDLQLIANELATNAVIHGGGSGRMAIWTVAGSLVCQVDSAGRLSDPLAGRTPAGRRQQGGRGLLLVNYLSDLVRVHVSDAGTAIRALLTLCTG
ncbi:sensor histidine kinase [Actinomycetes bacterium KLBMP 9797]